MITRLSFTSLTIHIFCCALSILTANSDTCERIRLVQSWDESAGQPIMRPLWFEFPEDAAQFATDDQFMLGPALLVAPVLEEGATQRALHLPPASLWYDAATGELPVEQSCPWLRSAHRVLGLGI